MKLLSTLWIELLSILWIELLSTAAGIAGVSRTQETKEQQQWGQRGVPWNTEAPAAEAEGGGVVLSLGTDRPWASTHSPLWIELLSTHTIIFFS